ncbi:MAG: hypothetical protein HQL63_13065 [Magnetococcales bacterium]|nr:hypothetical protein [Magnetococcales bacterium]MBF0322580.1 hypothetical protein [Magnetococcales bacterium]
MKPELVWVHGWALGPGMWRGMTRRLPEWRHQLPDLGFFASPTPLHIPSTPWVGIGHSLGFLWLLEEMRQERLPMTHCLGLVSINGFTRFCRGDGLAHGVHPKILHGMASRCRTDPETLLRDFRQKAGLPMDLGPIPMAALDQNRLLLGLQWLEKWDNRDLLAGLTLPILALAGTDDAVVLPAHTRQLFADHEKMSCHWLENGHHMLPLLQPAWCVEKLEEFLKKTKKEND